MVCAYTRSFPASKHSILLVKIDSSGTVAWSRSLEGENTNWPQSMIGTSDGGFLAVGDTSNALTTNSDILAIKFDSGATIEWIGIYKAAADNDYGWAVTESQEGGDLLTAQFYSYGDNSKYSALILRISSTG